MDTGRSQPLGRASQPPLGGGGGPVRVSPRLVRTSTGLALAGKASASPRPKDAPAAREKARAFLTQVGGRKPRREPGVEGREGEESWCHAAPQDHAELRPAEAGTRRKDFGTSQAGSGEGAIVLFRQKVGGPGGVAMGKSVGVTLRAARRGWDGGGCRCRGARKGRISLWHCGDALRGLVSVWHWCTLKEPAEPGGHGDVGVAGRDVGDAS